MDYVRRIQAHWGGDKLRGQEERRRGPESRRRDDGLRRYNGLRRTKKPPNKRNSVEHPARGGEPPKTTSLHMPVAAGESRRRDDGLRDITVCVDITFLILSADANVGGTPIPPPARGGEPSKTSLHMPVAAGESRRRDDGLRDITVCVDITFLILSADANVGGTPIPPPPPAIPKKRPKKRNLEEEQRVAKSKHRAHTQTPYSLQRKVF